MMLLPVFVKRRFNVNSNRRYESGQALLIILLVLAVALTLVLSTASRSITDIQTTSIEEDSLRAFSAAEAGVEEALIQQQDPPDKTLANTAGFTVDYTNPSPSSGEFAHRSSFLAGETATFWFVGHDANGDLDCGAGCAEGPLMEVCWGKVGTDDSNSQTPAIEVSVYYDENQLWLSSGDFSEVKVARLAFDSFTGTRNPDNNFTPSQSCQGGAGGTIDGQTFEFSTRNINFNSDLGITCFNNPGCLLMTRVKFLYNNNITEAHPVGIDFQVTAGSDLPPQGARIESTGTAGDATRKIDVFQAFGEVPFPFDSAVVSRSDLVK